MRKQGLLHVHALLHRIRTELQERGDVPADAYAEYDAHGVFPPHLHHRKTEHENAVEYLLTGIDRTIECQSNDNDTRRAALPPAQL